MFRNTNNLLFLPSERSLICRPGFLVWCVWNYIGFVCLRVSLRTRVCSAKDDSGKVGKSSSFDTTIVRVTSNGTVLWCPNAFVMSDCPIDVARFPFDKQQCSVDYELWGHDSEHVKLKARSNDVDLTYYMKNGEWDLIGTL
jgi:hypothetical protein